MPFFSGRLLLRVAAQFPDEFLSLSSVRLGKFNLYYEVHGGWPAVVFAHGSGGTHMSWWQQVPVFSSNFKCITFDHRGFGYSRDVADGPGRTAFVEDLKGLLDHLGIEKASLVGQSMGGSTVLGFAAAYPERVQALVMCDTTGRYTDADLEQVRSSTEAGTGFPLAESFRDRYPARWFLYMQVMNLTPRVPGRRPAPTQMPAPDIQPVVVHGIPTLFIVGDEDRYPPVIEAMHRKIPGSQLVKVPCAGHSVYWEKPEVFNRIVKEFLHQNI